MRARRLRRLGRAALFASVTAVVVGAGSVAIVALTSVRSPLKLELIGPSGTAIFSSAAGSFVSVTPDVLPATAMPVLVGDWTSVGKSVAQAVEARVVNGAAPNGFHGTGSEVGLVGDALATWVVTSAVQRTGGASKLSLPLSAQFDNRVAGPTEVFVSEYEFKSSAVALAYFARLDYVTRGYGAEASGYSNAFGDVTRVGSNVPGEKDFNIQWVSRGVVVNASVWGGRKLTANQALRVLFPVKGVGSDAAYSAQARLPWSGRLQ